MHPVSPLTTDPTGFANQIGTVLPITDDTLEIATRELPPKSGGLAVSPIAELAIVEINISQPSHVGSVFQQPRGRIFDPTQLRLKAVNQ
jgi:hypothetical protein